MVKYREVLWVNAQEVSQRGYCNVKVNGRIFISLEHLVREFLMLPIM